MLLRKGQLQILIVNVIYLLFSGVLFFSKKNYEFLMYVGIIIFFFFVILLTNKKVNYPNSVLWGLTLWGILHMLGGGLLLNNGTILYELILIPISKNYGIFRYDQFVHIIGFGVATLLMYFLLKPNLKDNAGKGVSISIVVIMAGLGVGALNEITEFIAVVIMPQTSVGGYTNTALDLVSNLIGAIFAMIYIRIKKGKI
jgi:uncharacterized membrane protein YjdF